MLSAVILRNECVTDCIPVCIEFPQIPFFEGRGVECRETINKVNDSESARAQQHHQRSRVLCVYEGIAHAWHLWKRCDGRRKSPTINSHRRLAELLSRYDSASYSRTLAWLRSTLCCDQQQCVSREVAPSPVDTLMLPQKWAL